MTYTEISDRHFRGLGSPFGYMSSLSKDEKYPPYNLIKYDSQSYGIQLAVAGFYRDEIDITLKGKILTISGRKTRKNQDDGEFLHRGIATRNFHREFKATSDVKLADARMGENGILTVRLEQIIPEERVYKIEIRDLDESE